MQITWDDISYLANGTERQREVYRVLNALRIFEILSDYTPILVGTIPLDIDVETSDLDIICEVHDRPTFERQVKSAFGGQDAFHIAHKAIGGMPAVVARFTYDA